MIPVVLLTGFLGSGKTSLLNRWLRLGGGRAPNGGRLAIVVNELGAVGIDGDLLPPGASQQVELSGGCVCCQLDDDLARTLGELVAARPDLELVVIETTGVADPLPIGWTLARAPLDRTVRLGCVVTVVDAERHLASRADSPSVDAQVDAADLLAISKLDLTASGPDDGFPPELAAHLRRRNPDAPIVLGAPTGMAEAVWQTLADPVLAEPRIHMGVKLVPAHRSADRLDSLSFPIEGTLDFEELAQALEALPPSVVRVKGIADVIDRSTGSAEPRRVAFHRVGARVSVEPAPPAVGASEHRMVAIGRDLDRVALAACLRGAMVG